MFVSGNVHTQIEAFPILDEDFLTLDQAASTGEALRAELSPLEAAEWTRCCVQRHLI